MTPEQEKLYRQIYLKLWQYFISQVNVDKTSSDNVLPKEIREATIDMYDLAYDYGEDKQYFDKSIFERLKNNEDTFFFDSQRRKSKVKMTNELKKILFDFHTNNKLKGNFEQYQGSIVKVIAEFIYQYVEDTSLTNGNDITMEECPKDANSNKMKELKNRLRYYYELKNKMNAELKEIPNIIALTDGAIYDTVMKMASLSDSNIKENKK